jgi:hypothetical protein
VYNKYARPLAHFSAAYWSFGEATQARACDLGRATASHVGILTWIDHIKSDAHKVAKLLQKSRVMPVYFFSLLFLSNPTVTTCTNHTYMCVYIGPKPTSWPTQTQTDPNSAKPTRTKTQLVP